MDDDLSRNYRRAPVQQEREFDGSFDPPLLTTRVSTSGMFRRYPLPSPPPTKNGTQFSSSLFHIRRWKEEEKGRTDGGGVMTTSDSKAAEKERERVINILPFP